MEIKKSPKASLENKKVMFTEIGLVAALALLLWAFNWSAAPDEARAFQPPPDDDAEEEIIPITQQMLKPPPPPPPAPKLTDLMEIVEDNTEVDEHLELDDAENDSENTDPNPTNSDDYGDYDGEAMGNDIFDVVENMPIFPEGNVNKWIAKHVKYPPMAVEAGISGKVYVTFVIEKDGSITDAKILRSVDSSLDKEALRVVNSMPKWKPGRQRDKPVRVKFTLPINFTLTNQ